jgi:hypothetical protein
MSGQRWIFFNVWMRKIGDLRQYGVRRFRVRELSSQANLFRHWETEDYLQQIRSVRMDPGHNSHCEQLPFVDKPEETHGYRVHAVAQRMM